MSTNASLIPFSRVLIHKTVQKLEAEKNWGAKQNEDEILSIADELILKDRDVAKSAATLAADFTGEATWVRNMRGLLRPLVTLLLTIAFLSLVLNYGSSADGANLQEALTIFLAVYGPILGFWFGQQTALKPKSPDHRGKGHA